MRGDRLVFMGDFIYTRGKFRRWSRILKSSRSGGGVMCKERGGMCIKGGKVMVRK